MTAEDGETPEEGGDRQRRSVRIGLGDVLEAENGRKLVWTQSEPAAGGPENDGHGLTARDNQRSKAHGSRGRSPLGNPG